MSKSNKKKVVVTTTKKDNIKPTSSKISGGATKTADAFPEMLYGWNQYKFMLIGCALIVVGLLLMTGGHNDDPNVWDENVIYNWRRTLLAPIVILAGLLVEIYAILKKK